MASLHKLEFFRWRVSQLIQNTASISLPPTPRDDMTKLQAIISYLFDLSVGMNNKITGSTVSARTLTASHDMTMVVVGIIVGIILIVFLVVIYVFLRRHGLPQVMIKSTNMNLVLIS